MQGNVDVGGRPANDPKPYMLIGGVDAKLLSGPFGDGYFGVSYLKAQNALYLGDAIETIHSFGGWQLHDNYFGRPGGTDPVTGSVTSVELQYVFSFASLLYYPQAFWGQGPDLVMSVFGMLNKTNIDNAQNNMYDGIIKFKFGTDLTYTPLDWLGVGYRFDYVDPYWGKSLGDFGASATDRMMGQGFLDKFMVFSPRLILRTAFVTHEQILSSTRATSPTSRWPQCSPTTSSPALPGSRAPTRTRSRSRRSSGSRQPTPNEDDMKLRSNVWTATLASGLLATATLGCIKPPPGQTPGAAPGSAASIGAAAPAAPVVVAATPAADTAAPAAPGAPAGPTTGGPAATLAALKAAGFNDCNGVGIIDDGEDGQNQNIVGADRGGYWYTFRDKKGTTIDPIAGEDGGTFAMTEGATVRSSPRASRARSGPAPRCSAGWG